MTFWKPRKRTSQFATILPFFFPKIRCLTIAQYHNNIFRARQCNQETKSLVLATCCENNSSYAKKQFIKILLRWETQWQRHCHDLHSWHWHISLAEQIFQILDWPLKQQNSDIVLKLDLYLMHRLDDHHRNCMSLKCKKSKLDE